MPAILNGAGFGTVCLLFYLEWCCVPGKRDSILSVFYFTKICTPTPTGLSLVLCACYSIVPQHAVSMVFKETVYLAYLTLLKSDSNTYRPFFGTACLLDSIVNGAVSMVFQRPYT